MNKLFALFVLVVACPFFSQAQTNPVLNAGNITDVSIKDQQVTFATSTGEGSVTVYSPSIIRVRIDKKKLGADFSYAVIARPGIVKTSITQDAASLTITTDSLRTVIFKKPFSIAFYTPSGEVINQDENGLNTSWTGEEVTTYKHMQEGERFIGLGEKTGNLDRRGNGYTNWNTDAFGYKTDQDPIYASIPFYIGIHHHLNYGIFLDNTFQTDFNFGASNNRFSSFAAQGGTMNYYFIYHTRLADIIKSYTSLTGRMPMPPLWSLGYQQNRYSYYPETEVLRVAATLREKKIPADGITLDIHYMDQYKLFTWNKERFPDPGAMNNKLNAMGFKTTVIVDPGIKVEKGYPAYESGLKADIFVKYSDSTNYTGAVWPGWCHFPDFTNEKGREWWRSQVSFFAGTGVSGIWNDMNEIATWGQKMPSNILFNYDGQLAGNKQAHNVYGMQMARSSYEGARAALNKRPFNLTRAGYAGLQRYAAIWTGDNRSEDDHMLAGIRLLNSMGLSGLSFTGMDIGGFTGNPSAALYARWIQLGAFNPYFRNHTAINTKSSEPWSYGEEVLEISRNFISLRYRLLPYLYAAFYESTQTGIPVMRSLAIENTYEPRVYDTQFQNQYQFGKAFLIAPFESNKEYGNIFFPEGKWYDFFTDAQQAGNTEKVVKLNNAKIPVYVKESSIIPMQSLVQSTAERPSDTLAFHIYKGTKNNQFVYYEDDGQSFDNEQGIFYERTILYNAASRSITFGQVKGTYNSQFKKLKIYFHGFESTDALKSSGTFNKDRVSMLYPISKFDPQGSAGAAEGMEVLSIVLPNTKDTFTISY